MEASSTVRLATLVALAWGFAGAANAQSQEWETLIEGSIGTVPWKSDTARAVMVDSPTGPLVSMVGEAMQATPGVVRVDPATGAPLWRAMLGHTTEALGVEQRLVGGPGRSSLVLGLSITKLAADGSRLWSAAGDQTYAIGIGDTHVDAGVLLDDGDAVVAIRTGHRVEIRQLASASGVTLARLTLPRHASQVGAGCHVRNMMSSGPAAFLVGGCPTRIARIDTSPLRITWSTEATFTNVAVPLHVDATGAYAVDTVPSIRKFDVTSGAALWSVDREGQYVRSLAAVPGGALLAVTNGQLEALDRTSGAGLWVHAVSGYVGAPSATAAGLVVTSRISSEPPAAFVERLDPTSGSVLWRTMLDSPGWDDVQLDRATLVGPRVVALGTRCRDSLTIMRCEVATWQGQADGTGFTPTSLTLPSSVVAATQRAGDGSTWTATLEWASTGQQLRLRRYRETDGVVLAEFTHAAPMPALTPFAANVITLKIGGDGHPVVLYSTDLGGIQGVFTDANLMKFHGITGALLWQRPLLDLQQGQIGIGATLVGSDSTGDVLVSLHEGFPNHPMTGESNDRRSILKLDTLTGTPAWTTSFRKPFFPAWFTPSPPYALVVGDDLVVHELPDDTSIPPWRGLVKLAGSTGTMAWSVASTANMLTYVPDASAIVTTSTSAPLVVRRIDTSSGAVAWTTTYEGFPDEQFFIYGVLPSPQHGLYVLGGVRREYQFATATRVTRGIALALDAVTGAIAWSNRFDDNPMSDTSSFIPRIVVGSTVYGSQSYYANISFGNGFALTALSIQDGTTDGSRFMHHQPLVLPHRDDSGPGFLLGREGDAGMLFASSLNVHHERPVTAKLARRAIAPATSGALAVNLAVTPATSDGDLVLDLRFTTVNAGATAVQDVDALLTLPAGAIVQSTACTIATLACSVATMPTTLEGHFDLPAGAELTITARLLVSGGVLNAIHASAFGPFSFAETTLKDNMAYASYTDTIHRHGFD
ncbi:outer membrane protein assembly factor BamB family protein [Dokdonella sp. MW10]|uniref:outer membrane protein assembly factor BamB family protein n=1 Tax=Dokdonella sp. MW10 TaxID=2992926 RepID=UPI003F811584